MSSKFVLTLMQNGDKAEHQNDAFLENYSLLDRTGYFLTTPRKEKKKKKRTVDRGGGT